MGIDYTLANNKNKTCLELGKGSWYALMDGKKGDACLLYPEEIYKVIVEEIWDYIINDPESEYSFWIDYAKEVATKIFVFVDNADPNDISLCNDSDDSTFELRQQKYRWVGSRYAEFDSDYANRHLKE
jgi:hypothetical protein